MIVLKKFHVKISSSNDDWRHFFNVIRSVNENFFFLIFCIICLIFSVESTTETNSTSTTTTTDSNFLDSNYVPDVSDQLKSLLNNNNNPITANNATSVDDVQSLSTPVSSSLHHSLPQSNMTKSQANVFEAFNITGNNYKDPLIVNAQSPNSFLSGPNGGGSLNSQLLELLRNNPRLQTLAQQNPLIAQQIMRNPALLRDPQIQRAIQSQLNSNQPGLLGQLGNLGMGLGRMFNPLGLSFGGNNNQGGTRNGGIGQNNGGGGSSLPARNHNNNFNNNQNGLANFGTPQTHDTRPKNLNVENTGGGYFGDNENPKTEAPVQENNEIDTGSNGGNEDNSGNLGNQDYDGQNDGGGDNNNSNGSEEGQQNPADDPDIQQLQNFGGPVNDNFPEGLFPPGLLTKEDLEEIRKQQEKQQQEADQEQQQQNQNQPENQGSDYDAGNNEAQGVTDEGNENTETNNQIDHTNNEVETNTENENSPKREELQLGNLEDLQKQQHLQPNNINNYDDNGHHNSMTPKAFHNSYQPIHHQQPKIELEPQINYDHEKQNPLPPISRYSNSLAKNGNNNLGIINNNNRNHFNHIQPNIEYDSPNYLTNRLMPTSTLAPFNPQYYERSPYLSEHNSRLNAATLPRGMLNNHFQQQSQQPSPYNSFDARNSWKPSYSGDVNRFNQPPTLPSLPPSSDTIYRHDDHQNNQFNTPRTTYSNYLNNNFPINSQNTQQHQPSFRNYLQQQSYRPAFMNSR